MDSDSGFKFGFGIRIWILEPGFEFGFGILKLGFWIRIQDSTMDSGFGFWIDGFRIGIQGFGFWIRGFGIQGFGIQGMILSESFGLYKKRFEFVRSYTS